jgi:hypothetical protein
MSFPVDHFHAPGCPPQAKALPIESAAAMATIAFAQSGTRETPSVSGNAVSFQRSAAKVLAFAECRPALPISSFDEAGRKHQKTCIKDRFSRRALTRRAFELRKRISKHA